MSKTVWIINQYASTPEYGYAGRHYYLGKELAKQGYKVYLITSASHHLLRYTPSLDSTYKLEVDNGLTMAWVKMPIYEEAHSKQRVLNWFIFPWRIQRLAKLIPDKPDAVLYSSPSLIPFLGAKRLAKKFKARLVFEVRDIWPQTLIEIGGYSPKHPLIRFMQWVEDKAYKDSDAVISNLKNAVEHMVIRRMPREKFNWIPNGFSQDEVNLFVPLNTTAKDALPENKFIIGYTGTLGVANAMDTFINAAELLKNHVELAFVLVGDGKEKERLKSLVEKKKLSNVLFIDAIPKVEIQSILKHFDACYIGWLKDDLYRFGIGANKIPEYLYSGKPILHSFSGACDPIVEANAGIQVEAENPEALSKGILQLFHLSQNARRQMGANGRRVAIEQYDYCQLAKKIGAVLFDDRM